MIPIQQKAYIKNLWGRLLTSTEVELQLSDLDEAPQLNEVLDQMEQQPAIEITQDGYCCRRCRNQQSKLFTALPTQAVFNLTDERVYCLNCLQMGRVLQGDSLYYLQDQQSYLTTPTQSKLTWQGTLSPEQARASKDLIESLEDSDRTHMVHAVTGAGKTEMIFPVIDHIIRRNGRVCVASPRIDVCIELKPRLQAAFESVDVTLLYGGSE